MHLSSYDDTPKEKEKDYPEPAGSKLKSQIFKV